LLQKLALPGHLPVTVLKRSFVYKNQYFQLAVVKPPAKPIMLLEIYDGNGFRYFDTIIVDEK
tara:strand:- start:1078 stop:1263 length:186 start_codon:yes stop_codon:yes gene_type:complete